MFYDVAPGKLYLHSWIVSTFYLKFMQFVPFGMVSLRIIAFVWNIERFVLFFFFFYLFIYFFSPSDLTTIYGWLFWETLICFFICLILCLILWFYFSSWCIEYWFFRVDFADKVLFREVVVVLLAADIVTNTVYDGFFILVVMNVNHFLKFYVAVTLFLDLLLHPQFLLVLPLKKQSRLIS